MPAPLVESESLVGRDLEEQLDFLLVRVLRAIEAGTFEVCGHQVPARSRQSHPVLRPCENLPAIDLARRLIETRVKLAGARPPGDAIAEAEAFLQGHKSARVVKARRA